jgi:hypothetical protein
MRINRIGAWAIWMLVLALPITACTPQAAQPALPPENQALEFYEFYSPM